MPEIKVLPQQVANLIAAGEVVERPANAVKEMVENALDAGATAVTVEIKAGGVEYLSVSDNGCGMAPEELPVAILRHATSKISGEEDLAHIRTLGFRGEALAAISATSRFTLISRRREDETASRLEVEGETVLSQEECAAPVGTTVQVRDLFFNQPARRKFLKQPRTESAAVLQFLQRLAASRPDVAFRFYADGEERLATPGNGKLQDAVFAAFGREFSATLTPLSFEEGNLRLSGFVTRPEGARNSRAYQIFYLNSRTVKSGTMQAALADAYRSFVKSEKFPGCVLFLEMPPEEADVNVHPTKLEVRFRDERRVYLFLSQSVRKALSALSNDLARDTYRQREAAAHAEGKNLPPLREVSHYRPPEKKAPAAPEKNLSSMPIFSAATPFNAVPGGKIHDADLPGKLREALLVAEEKEKSPRKASLSVQKEAAEREEVVLKKAPAAPEKKESPAEAEQLEFLKNEKAPAENPLAAPGHLAGCLFSAFLLYETENAVYVVDKHAAHERILYEALKKRKKGEAIQILMVPVSLSFSAKEFAALNENRGELEKAGFLLEEFGPDTLLLRGIPQEFTALGGEDLRDVMCETARELSLGGAASSVRDRLFDRVLYSMACKAAVKAGIPSTARDHEWIPQKLCEIDNILVCPHGRPVLRKFTKKQVENLFLRD